jgi:hypothetical protein
MRCSALRFARCGGFGVAGNCMFTSPEGVTEMSEDQPIDRKLGVRVNTTSNWLSDGSLGANVSYTEMTEITVPPFPGAVDPVTGNINLNIMGSVPGYTNNIDITFILNANMTDRNGNRLEATWARSTDGSGKYSPLMEGFCWFCASPSNWQPIIPLPAGMSVIRNGGTSVTIDDNSPNDNVGSYVFCLGLVVMIPQRHFITIEPVIVGKGATKPPTSSLVSEKC